MLQYLLWHVRTGRHQKMTLSFMLAGHMKFAPDWCFGSFKWKFWHTRIDSLDDVVETGLSASTTGMIIPQLCGDQEENVAVPSRDWSPHLGAFFRKFIGLEKYQHFDFWGHWGG